MSFFFCNFAGRMNVFVKPSIQNDVHISSGMARKGRMKSNVFVKPSIQNDVHISFGMARKGP